MQSNRPGVQSQAEPLKLIIEFYWDGILQTNTIYSQSLDEIKTKLKEGILYDDPHDSNKTIYAVFKPEKIQSLSIDPITNTVSVTPDLVTDDEAILNIFTCENRKIKPKDINCKRIYLVDENNVPVRFTDIPLEEVPEYALKGLVLTPIKKNGKPYFIRAQKLRSALLNEGVVCYTRIDPAVTNTSLTEDQFEANNHGISRDIILTCLKQIFADEIPDLTWKYSLTKMIASVEDVNSCSNERLQKIKETLNKNGFTVAIGFNSVTKKPALHIPTPDINKLLELAVNKKLNDAKEVVKKTDKSDNSTAKMTAATARSSMFPAVKSKDPVLDELNRITKDFTDKTWKRNASNEPSLEIESYQETEILFKHFPEYKLDAKGNDRKAQFIYTGSIDICKLAEIEPIRNTNILSLD